MPEAHIARRRRPPGSTLVPVRRAAEACGISSVTLWRWVRKGIVPAYRVGPSKRIIRVRVCDLLDYVPGAKN